MKLTDEVKLFFDEKYKTGKTPWVSDKIYPPIKYFADFLTNEFKSPTLLDIGCGVGDLTVYFAKNGMHVDAIDYSKSAITKAKKLAEKENTKNITFKVGDALDFPYQKKYDAVFDRGLFHHQPKSDWKRYLSGLNKVLKKDGFFFLVVFSDKRAKEKCPPGKTYFIWKDAKGNRNYNRYFSVEKIDSIFGKYFQIIKHFEDPTPTPSGSELRYLLMKKQG